MGNPNVKNYGYMKSYSPYDNVKSQAYPNMYISTGLHDSQVQYWEPAKWVAKLRTLKPTTIFYFSTRIWMRGWHLEDLKL
jgi:oligopeptidase B